MTHSLTEIEKMFDKEFGYIVLARPFFGECDVKYVRDRDIRIKEFYRSQFSALLTELGEKINKIEVQDYTEPYNNGAIIYRDDVSDIIQEYLPISEEK